MVLFDRITAFFAALALGAACAATAATIAVTTDQDADATDTFCSLREAIVAANTDAPYKECPAGAGDDRIHFALPVPVVIDLTADLPQVTDSLAIRGASVADLTIDGGDLFWMFDFDTPAGQELFVLADLTLRDGLAFGGGSGSEFDGGAVRIGPGERARFEGVDFRSNESLAGGGALMVSGQAGATTLVEIRRCTFANNVSQGVREGGAIAAFDAELAIADSTFSGNAANLNYGGAVYGVRSAVTVERSTFSGNTADRSGGAIAVLASTNSAALRLVDSTITGNSADFDGNGEGDGGGVFASGSVGFLVELRMVNSIVAGNTDDGTLLANDLAMELADVDLITTGWNLVGDNTGAAVVLPAGAPSAQGNFVGTAASPIDPMLEAIADNGGPTRTQRPVLDPASPVIDHGHCPDAAFDQRGWGDPVLDGRTYDHPGVANHAISDGCDIGAVERGASPNVAGPIFADDFESGRLLFWSVEGL
jgi:CSLREA domain-containing protein